jgi:DNA helicase II / ATP-dependent DNA helicase PcrA
VTAPPSSPSVAGPTLLDSCTHPGPPELGRSIVLLPGAPTPPAWLGCPEHLIDQGVLDRPSAMLDALHRAWLERRPVVIRLGIDPSLLRQHELEHDPPYRLGAHFEFRIERLRFLIWANSYDGTGEQLVWLLSRHAVRNLGCQPSALADVCLPDGRHVWCDGGPRGPLAASLKHPVVHGESLSLSRLTATPTAPIHAGQLDESSTLSQEQRAAVTHSVGPARVLAPAGSGKTRVLTARLRHLLVDRGYDSELVTAVAYNKRAVRELQERSQDFRPRVRTLHALGYELLREHGRAQVIDEREVRRILRPLVRLDPQRGRDPLASWVEALGQAPDDVERSRGDVPGFAAVFDRYRRHLKDHDLIDHDEQIYGAIELLLRHPEVRRRASRTCRHLLVDEFQDLTPAYLLLVRLLASPAYQVFAVGDDDQVIYGYLGATPQYLVDFERYFPGAARYTMQTNYRCHPDIVRDADHLLGRNQERVPKTLQAGRSDHPAERGRSVLRTSAASMPQAVVSWVRERLAAGVKPSEMAVLARINEVLLPVQLALAEHQVACQQAVGPALLDRTGVRAALLWLELAAGPEAMSADALQEAVHRPSRKIRRESTQKLARQDTWKVEELLRASRDMSEWEGQGLRDFVRDIRRLRTLAQTASAAEVLRYLRVSLGLGASLTALDASHQDAAGGSHLDDLQAIEQAAALAGVAPKAFGDWLTEHLSRPRQGGSKAGSTAITLSTVHRVKGLEWDHVLVYGLSDGLFPHRLSSNREEERRIFHVAITRARQHVRLLTDAERPAPLLDELDTPHAKQVVSLHLGAGEAPGSRAASPTDPKVTGTRSAGTQALPVRVGLKLETPHRGTISSTDDRGVLLAVEGGGKIRLPYGEAVTSEGKPYRLAPPHAP